MKDWLLPETETCIVLWDDIQYFSRINPASHCSRNTECHPLGLCMKDPKEGKEKTVLPACSKRVQEDQHDSDGDARVAGYGARLAKGRDRGLYDLDDHKPPGRAPTRPAAPHRQLGPDAAAYTSVWLIDGGLAAPD